MDSSLAIITQSNHNLRFRYKVWLLFMTLAIVLCIRYFWLNFLAMLFSMEIVGLSDDTRIIGDTLFTFSLAMTVLTDITLGRLR